jgi:hypothetical protein
MNEYEQEQDEDDEDDEKQANTRGRRTLHCYGRFGMSRQLASNCRRFSSNCTEPDEIKREREKTRRERRWIKVKNFTKMMYIFGL